MKAADPKTAAGRAFVRSLNILLKFARLYGYEHARTVEQLQVAWQELRAAVPPGTEPGLLLGATGSQLLLDGVPLEGSPAEKQFAQLLSAAGLASVQFFPCVTQDEVARFAHAFPTGKAKPSELAQQLKVALADVRGIRINEVCFVATDSRLKDATSVAAQLAAASLGEEQDQFKKWLNDPHKLLELIAAAEGSKDGGNAGPGRGAGRGGGGGGGGGGIGLSAGTSSVGVGTGATGTGGGGHGYGDGLGGGFGPGAGAGTGTGLGEGTGTGTGGTGTGGGGHGGYGDGSGSGSGAGAGTGTGAGGGLGAGTGPGEAFEFIPGNSGLPPGAGTGAYPGKPVGSGAGDIAATYAGPGGLAGAGGGTGRPTGFSGPTRRSADPSEDEILGILSALTSFGGAGTGQGGVAAASAFQQQVSELPGRAQDTLRQALAALAAQAPEGKTDESVLIKLAEHLAIRFALEKYERGEVKVNAVRQMLDRMNQEIENLRKILGAHEDKMTEAGIMVESHREILDRQFWAAVPESGKRAVLLSDEAWCIPPRNVQSYVASLIEKGDIAEAISILQNYASCAENDEADARKKTAVGLSELAELYAKADPRLLSEALRHLGVRLNVEQDAELQALTSAAFVRLSQEAATNRLFPVMEEALHLASGVEAQRPGTGRELRSKMGIEQRVPEFVEEALRARQVSAGLTNVLKLLPQAAIEQITARFNRCALREDAEHVANLAMDLGEQGLQYLRSMIRGGPAAEAADIVGLLSKLDPQAVEVFLPSRLKDFPRTAQDRIVRQISASNAPARCRIFLEILDHVDPLLMPLVIDEIGVTGEREALGKLLTVVDGDLPAGSGPYLQVKAIEALGRIHAPESVKTLVRVLEAKKTFGWLYPQEMRIAALQALEKLDPGWAKDFQPRSGIEKTDLALAPLDAVPNCKFVRQRRHTRVRLNKPVVAFSTNLKQNCRLEIKTASLSGGVATIDRHMAPGTHVQLKFQLGLRNLQATALLRDYRAQDIAFEFVDMSLDERVKFRRLLADSLGSAPADRQSKAVPPATTLVSS
jgi:hypothetical protein